MKFRRQIDFLDSSTLAQKGAVKGVENDQRASFKTISNSKSLNEEFYEEFYSPNTIRLIATEKHLLTRIFLSGDTISLELTVDHFDAVTLSESDFPSCKTIPASHIGRSELFMQIIEIFGSKKMDILELSSYISELKNCLQIH